MRGARPPDTVARIPPNRELMNMRARHSYTPFITDCPIGCAAALQATGIVLPEGPLRACPECGQLVSSVDASGYWASMKEFDTEAGTNPEEGSVARREKRAAKILGAIRTARGDGKRRISLLDVGCSSGAFMTAARARGFDVQGVEPAPKAAKSAAAAGFSVFRGTLEQAAFPEGSFDAIAVLEVIEHLTDPLSLLRECRRVLKTDGVLAIGTGNAGSLTLRVLGADWDYLQIRKHGGHISFFNPRSMRMLAQRTGFVVERIRTRRVSLAADGGGSRLRDRVLKTTGEIIAGLVAITGQGHDLLALLRPIE
ncbi:MAG: class I SAM-dependent methyltransferase [Betaproteobacteria bacterium]